jgi:hypothetical protein
MGHLVDHFTITVEGVPSAWVDGMADTVKLNPGTHTVIMLTVTVPASWQSRAGSYPVIVRARSEEAADESGVARAVWTVLAYVRYTVDVAPKRSTVWNTRTALFTVALTNDGNAPDSYTFTFKDDEQKLRHHFTPPVVARDPGEGSMAGQVEDATTDPGPSAGYWPFPWRRRVPTVTTSSSLAARLLVSAPWRLVGTKGDRPFTVEARAASDGSVQTVKGILSQRALIPIWVPPVAWFILAIVVAWWYVRTQPHVQVFDVVPTAVLPGHKGTLRYEVSNAQKLEIRIHPVDAQSAEPSPVVISNPRSSHLVRIGITPLKWQDTSYQVYVSNGCIWGFCLHSDASNGPITLRVLPTPTATPIPTAIPIPTALPTSIPRPTVPAPRPTAVLAPVVPPAPAAPKASTGKSKPGQAAKPKPKARAKPKRRVPTTHKSTHPQARPSPAPRSTATPIPKPTPKPTARPTSTPQLPRIKPFLGTWVNIIPRPQNGTLVRLVVKRVNARTLSFHGYFSCGGRVCDGGTIKVSLAGKRGSTPLTSRFKVSKQQLVVTIRRVGRRLLHALVIKRINGCTMCPSGSDYLLRQPTLPRPVTTPSPTPTTSTRPGGQ